ncbi:MAG: hypothetical protein J0H14_07025 [Alphaproteobacteria bacterium]|nr:hypothetical protein [Alphaproteobacteria bacterium]
MPAPSQSTRPWARAQPIRDAIQAFLTEPRTAKAIAEHIDRSVPAATGHLAAMRRRGLVRRLGFATYAHADYVGDVVSLQDERAHPIRDAILAYLTEPRSPKDVTRHLGRDSGGLNHHPAVLVRGGRVRRLGYAIYVRADAQGDAVPLPRERRANAASA